MVESIGTRIYTLRKSKGMTQEELGKKVGTTKATINKWETGVVQNLKRPKIELLAQALDTTPGYLMGWDQLTPGKEVDILLSSMEKETSQPENGIEDELLRVFRGLPFKRQIELLSKAYAMEDELQK